MRHDTSIHGDRDDGGISARCICGWRWDFGFTEVRTQEFVRAVTRHVADAVEPPATPLDQPPL